MDLGYILNNDDTILFTVFVILLLMSIITWTIILVRAVKLIIAQLANKKFITAFWNASSLEAAMKEVKDIKSPMTQVAMNSIKSSTEYYNKSATRLHDSIPYDNYLTRQIRHALSNAMRPFDQGLTALASIGATAPFIGLFGTVWGIYHALINIAQAGQVTLAVVSQPIGEALVATAFGLFVAIPAVLAYNALVKTNKNLSNEMDNFAHDLYLQLLNREK